MNTDGDLWDNFMGTKCTTGGKKLELKDICSFHIFALPATTASKSLLCGLLGNAQPLLYCQTLSSFTCGPQSPFIPMETSTAVE